MTERDDALAPDALSAYLDGELTETERAVVEAQLSSSAGWRAELAEVRAARDVLRGVPTRGAPEGFWTAVHAAVVEEDAAEAGHHGAGVVPIEAARSRRWRWAAAGAAAVAAVVAVVVIPGRSEVSPDVAAVVAQHGAQGSETADPVSMLAPVGPLAGLRR